MTLCTFALSGCGDTRPERVPVSGIVLLDGKPLGTGFVRVLPSTGRSAFGEIHSDGRFSLSTYESGDGCILGEHAVEIVAIRPTEESSAYRGNVGPHWIAPQRYADFRTSNLKLVVSGPIDSAVIELRSNSKKSPSRSTGKQHARQSPGSDDKPLRAADDGAQQLQPVRVARSRS